MVEAKWLYDLDLTALEPNSYRQGDEPPIGKTGLPEALPWPQQGVGEFRKAEELLAKLFELSRAAASHFESFRDAAESR